MKHRTSAGAAVLDSVESAAQFVEAHNISVVGFFDVSVDRVCYIHEIKLNT